MNRSSKDSFDIIGKSINQGVNKINQEIRLMTIDEVLRKVWLPNPERKRILTSAFFVA